MAQLAATVYVRDPETHQTVRLDQGTTPEARLAALVTNPAAWVDRKLPRLPKAKADGHQEGTGDPTGDGQDDSSGADSAASSDQTAPAKKTAARKTAASKPARGRDAADEGSSGD